MTVMPKAYPKEFRDDVVAIARRGEIPISQLAVDFGISEASIHNWMRKADGEDGIKPGLTEAERTGNRELRSRWRCSCRGDLPGVGVLLPSVLCLAGQSGQ